MPNYDYKCPACDTAEERNVGAEDRDKQNCEICHQPLKRVWSFKGSVWAPTAGGMR